VEDAKTHTVEPPRGTFQARVDEKGRLKLPAAVQQYLLKLGEEKVFITSLDLRIARIYPISVWKQNEKFFQEFKADAKAAADVSFIANDMGSDSELDGQGRVLIPTELRRRLDMENKPVWLDCFRGRLNVYSEQVYQERRRRAIEGLESKLEALEQNGLL
jgi:MraZ protein